MELLEIERTSSKLDGAERRMLFGKDLNGIIQVLHMKRSSGNGSGIRKLSRGEVKEVNKRLKGGERAISIPGAVGREPVYRTIGRTIITPEGFRIRCAWGGTRIDM